MQYKNARQGTSRVCFAPVEAARCHGQTIERSVAAGQQAACASRRPTARGSATLAFTPGTANMVG